ncbi:MAG: nitrite transporter [Pseudomonas sp.]
MNTDKYTFGIYVEGGRLWPHVDCYGLVLEVRRDLGLPAWPEWAEMRKADGGFARACDEMIQRAVSPCKPGHGAVAAGYRGQVQDHVAIVLEVAGALEVLEINPKRNVSLTPLRRFERRFARVEYYR